MVCTAMLTALQRTDSGRVSSIRIGIGRGKNTASKGGVVTATVLSVQRHHDVEHACFFRSELPVGTQHGKDGFGSGLPRNEAMHDHRLIVERGTLGIVSQHHDARQTGNKRDCRTDLVLEGTLFRLWVVSIQHEHRTLQKVHDVMRRRAHDLRSGEAIGQIALSIKCLNKHIELA